MRTLWRSVKAGRWLATDGTHLKEILQRFATRNVAADLERSGFVLGVRRVRASLLFVD